MGAGELRHGAHKRHLHGRGGRGELAWATPPATATTVTFVINTEPPEVGLNAVKTPSNNTKPSFSGTASESLPVTVKIYKGSKPEGTLAATAEASVTSGKWGPVSSVDDSHERDLHGSRRRAQLARQPHGPQLTADVRDQH